MKKKKKRVGENQNSYVVVEFIQQLHRQQLIGMWKWTSIQAGSEFTCVSAIGSNLVLKTQSTRRVYQRGHLKGEKILILEESITR